MNQIYHFEGKVSTHLDQMLTDIAGKSDPVISKLRRSYGACLLENLLIEDWSLFPSSLPQLDQITISNAVQIQAGVSNQFKNVLDEIQVRLEYLEERKNLPDEMLLTKIFSDNEAVFKVRKKDDPTWADLDEATTSKVLRDVCDANHISHHRAAIENISHRGKGYPFLKVTFTTQSERWAFTRRLNATKATHKYIISPMEPRGCQVGCQGTSELLAKVSLQP